MKIKESFATVYYMLVSVCLKGAESVEELNRRTGHTIRVLPGGASFRVDLSDGMLPTPGCRKMWPHVAAAELAWCLLGHNHVDWLRRHTEIWNQFADERECAACDGTGKSSSSDETEMDWEKCASCHGTGKTLWLNEAYGNRWKNTFGTDQLAVGLERLLNDSSNRRVWISSWDPATDILDNGQKTVPCPVGFTLNIVNGKLNSSLMIRSSDLYIGLPHDVMRHALLMDTCAASLGVDLGIMRVTLAHPHIYKPQWEPAAKMLAVKLVDSKLKMPGMPCNIITAMPDEYVDYMRAAEAKCEWPTYIGKTEVVA